MAWCVRRNHASRCCDRSAEHLKWTEKHLLSRRNNIGLLSSRHYLLLFVLIIYSQLIDVISVTYSYHWLESSPIPGFVAEVYDFSFPTLILATFRQANESIARVVILKYEMKCRAWYRTNITHKHCGPGFVKVIYTCRYNSHYPHYVNHTTF